MRAVYATGFDADDPLAVLAVGERPEPHPRDGWARVHVRAAALNHHDLWTLRGVGLSADRLPMILGCDAAGVDEDGNEVIVHAVIASEDWRGDETLDPRRSLLSELHQGTLADLVSVPRRNLVSKPPSWSWAEAACLPTSWLTAYRMLFTQSQLPSGSTLLVQGVGGGVASALIRLGAAAGFRVWATSRSESKRAAALTLGAERAFEPGQRLPERVDGVMDSVGASTWRHSLASLRPGGVLVTCGATSGANPERTELNRIFFLQLRIVGSTMGTRDELQRLIRFCEVTGVRPAIDSVLPLAAAADGVLRMARGDLIGKIVLTVES